MNLSDLKRKKLYDNITHTKYQIAFSKTIEKTNLKYQNFNKEEWKDRNKR